MNFVHNIVGANSEIDDAELKALMEGGDDDATLAALMAGGDDDATLAALMAEGKFWTPVFQS